MNVSEANATSTVLRALLNNRGRRTAEEEQRLADAAVFLAERADAALQLSTAHEVRRGFGR